MSSPLTWFVTGCSSGIGEELVLSILRRGDKAIATARAPISRLQHLAEAGARTIELDVALPEQELRAKLAEVEGLLEEVDVVVNNAGYIQTGALELLRLATIFLFCFGRIQNLGIDQGYLCDCAFMLS